MENTFTTNTAATNEKANAEIILVKYKTAEKELINAAKLGRFLAFNHGSRTKRVSLALPNKTWLSQCVRACKIVKADAVVCLPVPKLRKEAQRALAMLDYLACNNNETLHKLMEFEFSEQDCQELFNKYKDGKGFSLMNGIGALELKEFGHALSLLDGDEDALSLSTFIHKQLKCPTVRPHSIELSITTLNKISGEFDYVFCLACVDGLLKGSTSTKSNDSLSTSIDANQSANPSTNAKLGNGFSTGIDANQNTNPSTSSNIDANANAEETAAKENETQQELAMQQEQIINEASTHATNTCFVSYFTRIEKRLADAAHIPYARCKKEHDKEMAMTCPATFLANQRSNRPSTMSGQALLRSYGLN